jgi:UDP-3-O-[3-hydroxymyristoyl] glucosamine N-acyltransferase
VVVGDDVEIGANCTIDRSTFGETRLARGVKLDNQVHVGHNCEIGEGTVIAGATALAGGVKFGRYAICGGLTGVANRVEVGDGASIGALALVTKDIPPGGTAVGNPQREYHEHFRAHALLTRLVKKGRTSS